MKTDATKPITWATLTFALLPAFVAQSHGNDKDETLILMWSPYFDADVTNDYLGGCPELNCRLTYDRGLKNQSSAIVFYDRTLDVGDLPKASERTANQHFVFFLMESPFYKSPVAFDYLSKEFYTLTMSHRRDSDIYSPFGYFKPRVHRKMDPTALKRIANGKKRMIAWMGSNCKAASQRYLYMNELSKYIPVDIYGKCGPYKCPKTDLVYTEQDPCEQNLRDNYKFYLAFENSVCGDFVTEKIFNRAGMYLVPLVLNRTIYEDHLPPGSFIAVDDFGSPKQLAQYLTYLSNNVNEYIKYFRWMEDYETVTFPNGIHDGFCRLCQRLNDERESGIKISSKARDLNKWFVQESQCNPRFVADLLRRSNVSIQQ